MNALSDLSEKNCQREFQLRLTLVTACACLLEKASETTVNEYNFMRSRCLADLIYQESPLRYINGELLRAAEEAAFEVFLTTDKNIRYASRYRL
jgi:hypothetical protein